MTVCSHPRSSALARAMRVRAQRETWLRPPIAATGPVTA
jgi:hypothetical protein